MTNNYQAHKKVTQVIKVKVLSIIVKTNYLLLNNNNKKLMKKLLAITLRKFKRINKRNFKRSDICYYSYFIILLIFFKSYIQNLCWRDIYFKFLNHYLIIFALLLLRKIKSTTIISWKFNQELLNWQFEKPMRI